MAVKHREVESHLSRVAKGWSLAVEYYNYIAAAAFWLKFVDYDDDKNAPGLDANVAATDGKNLMTWPKYEKYTQPEKTFIFLHEMLHVLYAHANRANVMRQKEGDKFVHKIWNVACDAMINEALAKETATRVAIPKDLIRLEKLLKDIGQWNQGESVEQQLAKWSVEALYYAMLKHHNEKDKSKQNCPVHGKNAKKNQQQNGQSGQQQKGQKGQQQSDDGQDGDEDGNGQGQGQQGQNGQQPGQQGQGGGQPGGQGGHQHGNSGPQCTCGSCDCFGGDLNDIHEGCNEPGDTDQDTIRQWQQRVKLFHGMKPEFFDRLAGEMPEVETPWEELLRDFLHRLLGPRVNVNYAKPNRRWSGMEGQFKAMSGLDLPFSPAYDYPKPSGKVAMVVDTSGSIDDVLLNRFLAEVAAVLEKTDSEVRLIVCDADVHEEYDVDGTTDREALRKLKYSGGGGTDFAPAIAKAKEWEGCDAIVYLTDLYGGFGPDPGIPTLWAVPKECNAQPSEPPFGRVIQLD